MPTRTTRINRGWLAKMVVFLVLLAGLGSWGLYDALYAYPANGLADASFRLKNYLEAARAAQRLTALEVKVDNPAQELKALSRRAAQRPGAGAPLTDIERARLEWLSALSRVWKLGAGEVWINTVQRARISATGDEIIAGIGGTTGAQRNQMDVYYRPRSGTAVAVAKDGTRGPDEPPEQVLRDLQENWKTAKAPKPLAAYDLPAQWLFVIAGYGGALYLLVLVLRAASRRFAYDADARALTIPGGVTISPDEVKEFDKRRWHKFFLTLHLRDGRSYKLDLLRHVPLEEWVLEMERTAFPETAGAGAGEDAPRSG